MEQNWVTKPCLVCGEDINLDNSFPYRKVHCVICDTIWVPDSNGQYTTDRLSERIKKYKQSDLYYVLGVYR